MISKVKNICSFTVDIVLIICIFYLTNAVLYFIIISTIIIYENPYLTEDYTWFEYFVFIFIDLGFLILSQYFGWRLIYTLFKSIKTNTTKTNYQNNTILNKNLKLNIV